MALINADPVAAGDKARWRAAANTRSASLRAIVDLAASRNRPYISQLYRRNHGDWRGLMVPEMETEARR